MGTYLAKTLSDEIKRGKFIRFPLDLITLKLLRRCNSLPGHAKVCWPGVGQYGKSSVFS